MNIMNTLTNRVSTGFENFRSNFTPINGLKILGMTALTVAGILHVASREESPIECTPVSITAGGTAIDAVRDGVIKLGFDDDEISGIVYAGQEAKHLTQDANGYNHPGDSFTVCVQDSDVSVHAIQNASQV